MLAWRYQELYSRFLACSRWKLRYNRLLVIISGIVNIDNDLQQIYMWTLGSEASYHICPHIKCLSDIKIIHPINIYTPNGNTIISNFSCTIILDHHLHLHNVLYIPQFRFSLYLFSNYVRIYNTKSTFHTILVIFRMCLQIGWLDKFFSMETFTFSTTSLTKSLSLKFYII